MRADERIIFTGMRLLHDRTWIKDKALVVEQGKIKAIIPVGMVSHHLPARQIQLSADDMLVPGFIDLHIHGARGCDVMDGTPDALAVISVALAEEGVTGYLATTMTAPQKTIEKVLGAIPLAMQQKQGAAILGVHLEGPFIAKNKRGAQNEKDVQLPNPAVLTEWQRIAQGAIKLVTLAPELPKANELIEALHKANIIVSVGHTEASYEQTVAAIDLGCTHATHLFNAMTELKQRAPGAVGALLLSGQVTAELIVDGVHLHPAIVDLAYRLKGEDRVILVSDAMRAKCLCDGRYDLGGQQVIVEQGVAALADGTLAGSLLTLPQAIQNITRYTACTLVDALRMASYNPARKLQLETRKGSIEVGKDADLVVLSPAIEVKMTMRDGAVVFER